MYQEISRIALLGTDQTGLPESLRQYMEDLDLPPEEDPARALLVLLSAVGQMRKAGRVLRVYRAELPEAAEPEEATVCSEKSLRYLEILLRDNWRDLLPEFFGLLDRHHQVLPPETIPELIEATRRYPRLLESVLAVAGENGRWLLHRHASFRPLVNDPEPEHWDTGTPEQRVAFLTYLRQYAPDSARELLAQTWDKETYQQRARLIATFATNRDGADEELLNLALSDGRREVRTVAADLLARLDGSEFSQRMRDRAEEIISPNGTGWSIELPEEPDREALADGILSKRADSLSGGVRANYLVQLLRFVHPDFWTQTGAEPPEVTTAWSNGDHADNALHGLARAAILHESAEWATALLQTALAQPQLRFLDDRVRAELLGLVPAAAFNELIRAKLAAINGVPGPKHPVLPLLAAAPQPFSDKLALRLVRPLQRLDRFQANQTFAYMYPVLMNAALRVDPKLYPTLDSGWNREELRFGNSWEMVDTFQQTLLFRREMADTFSGV